MRYTQILAERRDAVCVVTLNRPDKLNAWRPHMASELAEAFGAANEDPSIGAIVMTGAGRGFCAGADMDATFKTRIDGRDPGENTAGGDGGMPAGLDWVDLCRKSKPLIAAVGGAAVGVGMTMILPFDVLVASEKAKFGMFFIKMGLVPELGSTHLLVQRVGWGKASHLCLSGRLCDGEEAAAIGLVDELTAHERLLERAVEVAAEIAANPDPQLRMIKQLLTQNAADGDLRAVQERETLLLRECWKSAEHKEAVEAFLARRPARFR
ncbi:MAG TPA: enoyl-CoA hydratase/isomerase family protein [Candidatus Limnocylindrales bacterium]|nr:enoyl-CoA hydratase/isomerase family protein [Candidatus Limnocylindrales bacterium]